MVFSEILEALEKLAARLCSSDRRITAVHGAAGGNEMPPERLNPLPA